ncbi:metallothionein-like protein 4A [Punica granatum]|nr:metallothionein-like protein 4A [Punica granatum]
MADRRETAMAGCNDQCGCPSPCPGGDACRCATKESTAGGADHKKCPCGEHCSCNPCTCEKSQASSGSGRPSCTCGPGCTCETCAA